MKQYKNRVIDRLLADKLEAMGAVLIEGPKYCGKTRDKLVLPIGCLRD